MRHPDFAQMPDTPRVVGLRARVRNAMEAPPVEWPCPDRIARAHLGEPLIVRKARAVALKLSTMPTDQWEGQPIAGSMTLEDPRFHAEWAFPDYTTEDERAAAAARGMSIHSVFGHIVPDYPSLLHEGLAGVKCHALEQAPACGTDDERAFLQAVVLCLDAVADFAARLAERCEADAARCAIPERSAELARMGANLRRSPLHPPETYWQALQAVWLIHMALHSTLDRNAVGRADQFLWPYLRADIEAGRTTWDQAAELTACFCLKFNERAKTTDDQRPEERAEEHVDLGRRTRHYTSSQVGTRRDSVDATNHWLQNIVLGGLTPEGGDGTNPVSFMLLEAYRRNRMTNPLLTVRVHRGTPDALLRAACETLRDGGGMPAFFSDEAIVPALESMGFPRKHARDYTNDGCWEVILPGRTDFRFQRLSLMLCLEWALNRGIGRLDGERHGPDTGDAREFERFDDVLAAWRAQLDAMVERVVVRVAESVNDRSAIAPVPLLSALTDGAIEARRDLTAGGARYRTYGMLAEAAAHAIDSLVAIKTVVFDDQAATMAELCAALDADFAGYGALRARLLAAPKYGNDDERADGLGRDVIGAYVDTVRGHAERFRSVIRYPCGVGTFSWYIGIGQGLGASPDGRLAGEPVSSNFSPALGRDMLGLPSAVLSYGKMGHSNLPAGGPLDLRVARHLVEGDDGAMRLAGLVRGLVDTGGAMVTLTVADTEELRAAQSEPELHRSLRVRMGGWCAYFTMLSREQQDHHIRRQEGRH